jgi:hypothetical protein
MALVWNTRLLLSRDAQTRTSTPVEFHFLSRCERYDSNIVTVDRHHSSAGGWAVYGDNHWYSVSVISHPSYRLPQELCLSFDCFHRTESFGEQMSSGETYTLLGPPTEEVALEFGTLLSVLVRCALVPIGVRRLNDKPVKFENPYNSVSQSAVGQNRSQSRSARGNRLRLLEPHRNPSMLPVGFASIIKGFPSC